MRGDEAGPALQKEVHEPDVQDAHGPPAPGTLSVAVVRQVEALDQVLSGGGQPQNAAGPADDRARRWPVAETADAHAQRWPAAGAADGRAPQTPAGVGGCHQSAAGAAAWRQPALGAADGLVRRWPTGPFRKEGRHPVGLRGAQSWHHEQTDSDGSGQACLPLGGGTHHLPRWSQQIGQRAYAGTVYGRLGQVEAPRQSEDVSHSCFATCSSCKQIEKDMHYNVYRAESDIIVFKVCLLSI